MERIYDNGRDVTVPQDVDARDHSDETEILLAQAKEDQHRMDGVRDGLVMDRDNLRARARDLRQQADAIDGRCMDITMFLQSNIDPEDSSVKGVRG